MQAYNKQIVIVPTVKETARFTLGRKAIKDNRESALLSPSTSEKSAVNVRSGERLRVGEDDESLYGKVERERSTKAGGSEQETVLSAAKVVASSSQFDIPGGTGACKTYSS